MRESLDWDYVKTELAPLAEVKEDPTIMARLAALLKGYGALKLPQKGFRLESESEPESTIRTT